MLSLNATQMDELRTLMRRADQPHVRVKAIALWNLGRGKSRQEVADFVGVSVTSLSAWTQRFRAQGAAGLAIQPGRGRRAQADVAELERYLRQSPRAFGQEQTRWTLRALGEVVPGLQGLTAMGIWKALQRAGFHYKRGQPHLHSPDSAYEEKRGAWTRPSRRPPPTRGRS